MTAPLASRKVIEAVRPVVEATGCSIIGVDEADQMDVPIAWDGNVVAYARIGSLADALGILVGRIEEELGAPLQDLDRSGKQTAIRLLDDRGAFQLRKSIEEVADLMEVSRITIYNYLNAIRG